jgi:uncharacterized protein (TIGR02246 family)
MRQTVLVLGLVLAMGCSTSYDSMSLAADSVESAIRSLQETAASAARSGNVEEVLALYADDVVVMAPNLPPLRGKAAARQFWNGFLAAGRNDMRIVTEDVMANGDLIVERGRYEMTIPAKDNGKYVAVWRNRGGKWLMVTDIFNSNVAALR